VPWIAVHWAGVPLPPHRRTRILSAHFLVRAYRKPDEHPRVSKAELDYIRCILPNPSEKSGVRLLAPPNDTFAVGISHDPIWFLSFLGSGLPAAQARSGVDEYRYPHHGHLLDFDVGSVAGGLLSSRLIHRAAASTRPQNHHAHLRLASLPLFLPMHRQPVSAILLIGLAAAVIRDFPRICTR